MLLLVCFATGLGLYKQRSFMSCKKLFDQNQAFSHLARDIEDLDSSQMNRDELFLKFKEVKAKQNWEHEVSLTQIHATGSASATQACVNTNW